MIVKVEPTGCLIVPENPERRATEGCWIKVTFQYYPEPTDVGFAQYEKKHHVNVPVDWAEYELWVESLPKDKDGVAIFPNPADPYDGYPGAKHWVYNPLINHCVRFEPDVTDAQILDVGETLGKVYTEKLAKGEGLEMPDQIVGKTVATPQRLAACEAKKAHLEITPLERTITNPQVAR
jgi:hypothetical protein